MAKARIIKMVRDPAIYPAPHEADVNSKMVREYKDGGWVVASSVSAKNIKNKLPSTSSTSEKKAAKGKDAQSKSAEDN